MTSETDTAAVLVAAEALSNAFDSQDLTAALSCFADDDEVVYVGSEPGERAIGRSAVVTLLGDVFGRPESYSWRLVRPTVWTCGDVAGLCSEAVGRVRSADGSQEFAYRLTGSLERINDTWRWRICHGSEPSA